jgi:hypothetical protein
MQITIDLDDLGVDGKGEALRFLVFNQHQGHEFDLGCYRTFDVNFGFKEIDPNKYKGIYDRIRPDDEDLPDTKVTAYENKDIVAMWWWDGDGDLTFWIKGEPHFYNNSDCKCSDWQEIDL